ncbi:MAG: 16S rRNA (cytosine(1402)-N(4))-methyltransferase RsmH [Candidatus Taylorbacteria bacterium]|nr:16S rRNA (cytosine(1402)-N(4))-methyltransferase RsmH [Candidatus Taylorbacteria bacterium]
MTHIPVLLQEVVEGLQAKAGEVILDATVGGGGHSEVLCKAMGRGRIVCLDADEDAIERSKSRLQNCGCEFLFYQTNYRYLDQALASFGIEGVNRALFDLGLSSFQLEESGRGFSFMRDEPLRMTFQKSLKEGDVTAEIIVNEWSEDTLATLLESYGDEKQARRIARKIVEAREHSRISTTFQLAGIVESVVKRKGKIHPATKTFQALRIAVNDEFQGLRDGLAKAWEKLLPGGRIAVISFHSIEDRTVKDFFRELGSGGAGKVITKKPIVPGEEEVAHNPRARSAKLRIIEKVNVLATE